MCLKMTVFESMLFHIFSFLSGLDLFLFFPTFSSGWAWLVVDKTGATPVLKVLATPNQDNPGFTVGVIPILGLDVSRLILVYYVKKESKE